jgi:hypothetical protein
LLEARKPCCGMLEGAKELPAKPPPAPSREPRGEVGLDGGGDDIGVENGLLRGTVRVSRPGLGGLTMFRGDNGGDRGQRPSYSIAPIDDGTASWLYFRGEGKGRTACAESGVSQAVGSSWAPFGTVPGSAGELARQPRAALARATPRPKT